MAFTDEQIKMLEQKLEPKNIKQRSNGKSSFDYIEGWHAITEANRIFGYSSWDRKTELIKLADPVEQPDRYGKDQWVARYMATVTIIVRSNGETTIKQGVGYGDGFNKDLGGALEGAIKEAETDATKRALSLFGNQFGLALYDKDKANVGKNDVDPEAWGEQRANDLTKTMKAPTKAQISIYNDLMDNVDAADNLDGLDLWVNSDETKKLAGKMTKDQKDSLKTEIRHRRNVLEGKAA